MKNIFTISICFILLLLFSSFIYSQEIGQGEFMIVNKTGIIPITVKIYPVYAIYSGGGQYTVDSSTK